jgi:lincosamide nucleotidyltransferase A/C/D/E
MPESRVLAVLDLLAEADVQVWVAGGWGIDALVGRQTRRHDDLDLVISNAPEEYLRLEAALTRDGFRAEKPEFNAGLPMPWRHAWHDDGHCIEVMPVPLGEPPFGMPLNQAAPPAEPPFDHGRIGGQPVLCLAARLQIALHKGYPTRRIDISDLELLRAHTLQKEERTV